MNTRENTERNIKAKAVRDALYTSELQTWIPNEGEMYFWYNPDTGEIFGDTWHVRDSRGIRTFFTNRTSRTHRYRLSVGNVHKTLDEAEKYQRAVEEWGLFIVEYNSK